MVHASRRPSDQITLLDVLWGLVLLGILTAQVFSQPVLPQLGPVPLGYPRTELPVQFLVQLLVSGQFERMGSFLLGLGAYRGWQRAVLVGPDLPGMDARRIVRRLLMGLLGIGLVFSLLFGSADGLVKVALLGFTRLYFRNQSVSRLRTWLVGIAILAILVPNSRWLLHALGLTTPCLLGWPPLSEWLFSDRSISQGFGPTLSYELLLLNGLLVGKLGISLQDARLRVRLSLLQVMILPMALLLKGVWVVMALGLVALPDSLLGYQPLLLMLSGFFGPLLLTLAYLLDVGVKSRSTPSGWARWPGRIGQMSLTNYSLQSLLCPLLLYGYDVVSGPPTVWGRTGIIIGIFLIQLGFSWLWGKHHRLGPLEWVCSQWIVGKWGAAKFSDHR